MSYLIIFPFFISDSIMAGSKKSPSQPIEKKKGGYHLNGVWSIWYCVVVCILTSYLVYTGVLRFISYTELPWPSKFELF